MVRPRPSRARTSTGHEERGSQSQHPQRTPSLTILSETVNTPNEDGQQDRGEDAFAHNPLPGELKHLRACMICCLIKTETEFDEAGCDNCKLYLNRAVGQGVEYLRYTSANFEGMIAMIDPKESWVAKWQRIGNQPPGVYAVNVRGTVERWLLDAMFDAGLPYFSRDKDKFGQVPNLEDEIEMRPRRRRRKNRKTTQKPTEDAVQQEGHQSQPEATSSRRGLRETVPESVKSSAFTPAEFQREATPTPSPASVPPTSLNSDEPEPDVDAE